MITIAALLSLSFFLAYLLFPVTFRAVAQPLMTVWWRPNNLPVLFYKKESSYINNLLSNCGILKERYSPPLWGYIGHIQTILFSLFGRFKDRRPSGGKRVELPVTDGSVVSYDLHTPQSEVGRVRRNVVLFVVPGVNNTAQSDYMRSFISFSLERNYHIAVLNHTGSLKDEPLRGHRIFTYSGCGDTYLMYKDLLRRYGNDVKFVGVGFSLGAFNLVRFLAEDKSFQEKFLGVFSFCQGYCPAEASTYLFNWSEIRRVYSFIISKRLVQLLRRHKTQLFGNHNDRHHDNIKAESIPVSSIDSSRDMNGFPLDKSTCLPPDNRVWSATSVIGVDELYSRRVMGFNSALDLYSWCSCKTFLHRIPSLPILFVNAIDDPLIPEQLHDTVIDYITKHNPNSILIQTHHGGHLGYYEGGILTPNELSWIDRLVFECVPVINKLSGCN